MFKGKKSSLYVLGICLLMGIVVGVVYRASYNTYIAHQDYAINELREKEWEYVESQLVLFTRLATDSADEAAENIRRGILENYPDLPVLQRELEARAMSPALAEIMRVNLADSFFGVDNDNHRVFVCDEDGVISDFSITKATLDGVSDWETRIAAHANPTLAQQAIQSIVSKDYHAIKFWEDAESRVPDHRMIPEMTVSALREVYMAEGLEGLRSYVFLCPSYIEKNRDIFGVEDVSADSVRKRNNKLIVVQRFNLVEQLEAGGLRRELDDLKIQQERVGYQKAEEQRFLQIIVIACMSFVLVMFFALSSRYNREAAPHDKPNPHI
jgi:hypothetical protein